MTLQTRTGFGGPDAKAGTARQSQLTLPSPSEPAGSLGDGPIETVLGALAHHAAAYNGDRGIAYGLNVSPTSFGWREQQSEGNDAP